ncbi:hypothetical protein EDD15DRAFT_2511654 [Pisolithus albus]|nr:hypothetical protein EDD15DRAFT_2511654 [Pisolithus albus]
MASSKDTPFPSPGSSFLPPPIPVAHEFALLRKHSKDGDLRQDDPVDMVHVSASSSATDDVDPPNGVVSPIRVLTLVRSFLPRFIVSLLNIPTSLLRMVSFQDSPPDSTHTPPTPSGLTSTQAIPDVHRLSTHSAVSLTSSRPAPPSPAMSRRASGHLSRSSSTARSRPPSGTTTSRPTSSVTPSTTASLSRNPSGRRPKDISNTPMSAVTESVTEFDGNETIDTPIPPIIKDDLDTPLPHLSSQPRSPTTPTPHLICIRDYAFPPTDIRFSGDGPHVPRPNRPRILARKLRKRSHSSTSNASTTSSTTTTTTSSENGDNENDNDSDSWGNQNGWGTFGWGWGIPARMSMSGRNGSSTTSPDAPSRSDLDRNFEVDSDSDAEYVDVEEDFPVDTANPSFSQTNEDDDDDFGNDLLPGLYRALYPFEPEGTAEMRLEEDQIVRVLGRGGGVGWAVVVKDGLKDNGIHALVPESYLEVVKLDCEGEVDPGVDYEAAGGKDA